MKTPATTPRQRSVLLVGLAYAAFVSLGLPDGLTGVAWPSIRSTFGLSLDALGALITSLTIGYLVSSFTSGSVLARLGVGRLLALSCLATAASLLGYSASPLWGTMVGLGLLAGLGAGAIDAGLNTYAAENFSPRTVNWLHASFGLGAATGPLIMSGVITAGHPWRLGYLIVGLAQLVLAGAFWVTRARWQAGATMDQPAPASGAPMARTLARPAVWLSILLFFLYTGLEITAGQWAYSVLTEARGQLPATAGVWVSLYWGSLMAGRVLSGVVVAHIEVRTLLRLCMLGAVLGVSLFWLGRSSWLALGGLILLGAALAPMFPSLISLTPARMGPDHAANTVGFQIAAAMIGGATLVSAFGLVAERAGLETLGPFMLVAALGLAAVYEILERRVPARPA